MTILVVTTIVIISVMIIITVRIPIDTPIDTESLTEPTEPKPKPKPFPEPFPNDHHHPIPSLVNEEFNEKYTKDEIKNKNGKGEVFIPNPNSPKLYNGICLPWIDSKSQLPSTGPECTSKDKIDHNQWPPTNLDRLRSGYLDLKPYFIPPKAQTFIAPYEILPPPVIDISIGRQLFVDDFLFDPIQGIQGSIDRVYGRPYDINIIGHQNGMHWLEPGGVIWDPLFNPISGQVVASSQPIPGLGSYRFWTRINRICLVHSISTSTEDVNEFIDFPYTRNHSSIWEDIADSSAAKGVVLCASRVIDSFTVWIDESGGPWEERYKMTIYGGCISCKREKGRAPPGTVIMYVSPDGLHWRYSGETALHVLDRSSLQFNPFRNIYSLAIKQNIMGIYRSFLYHEEPYFGGLYNFTRSEPLCNYENFWGQKGDDPKSTACLISPLSTKTDPVPWMTTSLHDLPNIEEPTKLDPSTWTRYKWQLHQVDQIPEDDKGSIAPRYADLYGIELFPYESLMIASLTVFNGRVKHPKNNVVHLGYSRDGFHVTREKIDISPSSIDYYQPFLETYKVGTIYFNLAYGIIVGKDEITLFGSTMTNYHNDRVDPSIAYKSYGENVEPLRMKLRRDGFAAMVGQTEDFSSLTTRSLIWKQPYLWINIVIEPKAKLQIELLDDNEKLIVKSKIIQANRDTKIDSTAYLVEWSSKEDEMNVKSRIGKSTKIRFKLTKNVSLYSFWWAKITGESEGFVGSGSPEYNSIRDTQGPIRLYKATRKANFNSKTLKYDF